VADAPLIPFRQHGSSGPCVVLLHGGPGVAGYLEPLARGLSDSFRVLEPFQRRSGGEPLTVAAHVADLDDLLEQQCGEDQPILVGHSWGAMLALAHAAKHPGRARSIVLIGCGTFDLRARARMREILKERTGEALRRRLERLPHEWTDPDQRLRAYGDLVTPLYSHDVDGGLDIEACDARGHNETWADMLRLQDSGVYPAAFAAIHRPVLMLHGSQDPHPGQLVRASLQPFIARLQYREWDRCGHYPWLERSVRDDFRSDLRQWLAEVPEASGVRRRR
jgi:pimeloyl-ACP methyl ester carboxylesterase